MGHGSYTASDWSKLRNSRGIKTAGELKVSGTTQKVEEVFVRRTIDPRFDPRYINVREARDSEDHPNSTPVIIGLDVTASMGYLSQKIASEALNELMLKLYSTEPIEDPALMFAAYGDFEDAAPLQVTQFESDIRIAEQLLDLWFVNCGSGLVTPNLLWYFAAKHTSLDSYEKHDKKKGFIFTIGDNADCRVNNMRRCFESTFGEEVEGETREYLNAAKEKFEIFHIAIGGTPIRINQMLPGHLIVINKEDIDELPEIIISAMEMNNGKTLEETASQWPELKIPVVKRALANVTVGNSKKGFFF